MDTGTIIVRGIAERIALEVVPLRLQHNNQKWTSKPLNNRTGTSEHSEHSQIGVASPLCTHGHGKAAVGHRKFPNSHRSFSITTSGKESGHLS